MHTPERAAERTCSPHGDFCSIIRRHMESSEPATDVFAAPTHLRRSRVTALCAGILPGFGHIYWGRERLGLGLFTVYALCFFTLTYGYFFYVGAGQSGWIAVSFAFVLALHGGSWLELFLRTQPTRVRAEEERRARCLREGTLCYLKSDLESAEERFLSSLSVDPFDVEAQFRLAIVCSRAGRVHDARKWLRRADKHDLEGKWYWEIAMERRRLMGEDSTVISRNPTDVDSRADGDGADQDGSAVSEVKPTEAIS